MATMEETLTQAIASLADKAVSASQATQAVKYAAAANQLAEARAWLTSPSQSHGGFSYGEGAK